MKSVYSKMYLVTPTIYDKLLKSIDEKDIKIVEQLNIDKDAPSDRLSEKYLETVTAQEFEQPLIQESIVPSEVVSPEFIDPESEFEQPEQTFGQVELAEAGEIHDPQPTVIEEGRFSNPLRTDCALPEVQEKLIPKIVRVGVKKGGITKPVSTTKGLKRSKIIMPQILKNPQILRVQTQDVVQPSVGQIRPKLVVNYPSNIPAIKDIKRRFVCNICKKGFLTSYHLNRHVQSVHKNIIQKSDPTSILPEEDIQMQTQPIIPQPGTSTQEFPSWNIQQTLALPGKKRSAMQAKLPYSPRPTKMRSEESDYPQWN